MVKSDNYFLFFYNVSIIFTHLSTPDKFQHLAWIKSEVRLPFHLPKPPKCLRDVM